MTKERSIASRGRRIRRAIVIYVLVPYLSVVVIFTLLQRQLMYQPTKAESLPAAILQLDRDLALNVQLSTPDGETLHGWLVKHSAAEQETSGPILVYFPGNSLNRAHRTNDVRDFRRCGFDVLIFDYRGYGDSTGSTSEAALTRDARQIWNYVRDELGYPDDRIVVFGESLGGAVALSLWSRKDSGSMPRPAAVLLSSTFASMPKTVRWQYPMFPFDLLVWDRWPSIDRIPQVKVPVIVFHGTNDRMIPIEQGRELAAAGSDARFIEILGGEHNEIPSEQLDAELIRLKSLMQSDVR